MKKGSAMLYSALPSEAPAPAKSQPSRSPRKTIEGASSSISNAVVTSVNSARKIKDRACSLVSKKLLSSGKKGGTEEATPVIFFADDDPVVKDDSVAFVDPFSFENPESPDDKLDARDDAFSPSTIVPQRLFQEDRSNNNNFKFAPVEENSGEDCDVFTEMVSFDCPIFTIDSSCNRTLDDTSIDLSETIKSINDMSRKETKAFLKSIRAKKDADCESPEVWRDTMLPAWDGCFKRSESFTSCEWGPDGDDATSSNNLPS